ncbi:acyl-CoA dehydrogenase NM domain-like protein [Atractiella rhizophila]|nr:acyl-CoA dehydrogenase NM domain-like protein [Atractiella rhizophila]
MAKSFTIEEVEKHNNEKEGVWIVIDGGVYDVTSFLSEHPGGKKILLRSSGKDSSEEFWKFHNKAILEKQGGPLKIGTIGGAKASEGEASAEEEEEGDGTYFGDLVPFGDPFWYQDWSSPYYNDSHKRLRSFMRKFVDKEIMPYVHEWDEAKEIPLEVYKKVGDAGILASVTGHWPVGYDGGLSPPGGVKIDEWDGFHNLIVVDELSRTGSGGILWGLCGGIGIGLPPVIRFGTDEMKARVVPPCVKAEKRICLAITEPAGGSDVANLTTTAVKTKDGKHYIVNGEKKWITNGIYCDYFTTAVRTGGKGFGGISLLLIEKDMPGVKTRKMDCSGVWSSGTTYITFEDVKVPVENLIGKENKGFQLIMSNFNTERMGIAIQANRFARVCLEESIKYASKRKTFGVLLRDHPVIRNKMAHMARKIESTHAWIETLVYQANTYDEDTLMLRGGGPIALVKAQSTDTFEYCAREAAQIFGGLAYTRGGQGEKVERLYREVRAYAIPGGSEEIMLDLGMRQAVKIAEIMGAKL